jgi:hypothetical protein
MIIKEMWQRLLLEGRAVMHPDKEHISVVEHGKHDGTTPEYMRLFLSAKFDGLKSHFDSLRF